MWIPACNLGEVTALSQTHTLTGVGFLGVASILIAQYKPLQLFTVVRHIDLEVLSTEQLEELQQEMKLSQQLAHANIACYLTSFVVGIHLWAVQPLMHYGQSDYCHLGSATIVVTLWIRLLC